MTYEEELASAIARHPSSQKKIVRPKPTLIVLYRCCWHCGDDPQHEANTHIVPCNEAGECEGKEVVLA